MIAHGSGNNFWQLALVFGKAPLGAVDDRSRVEGQESRARQMKKKMKAAILNLCLSTLDSTLLPLFAVGQG